jgi:glutamine amidotransferase
VELSDKPEQLAEADFLVLPGVGAFGDGMASLLERKLIEPILAYIATGKPFLGICLGMQLLLDSSQEFGQHQGLGVIPGAVRRLPSQLGVKLPNIGWHPLFPLEGERASSWVETILSGMTTELDMYFVHSYAAYPSNPSHWLSGSRYGDHMFCSTLQRDNVSGCQFHPEKSGPAGLAIIERFLNSDCRQRLAP